MSVEELKNKIANLEEELSLWRQLDLESLETGGCTEEYSSRRTVTNCCAVCLDEDGGHHDDCDLVELQTYFKNKA